MTAHLQTSVLDALLAADADGGGSPGPALRPLDGVERTVLTHGAWVDVLPGWVTGSDELFLHLVERVPWREERRRMYERVVEVPRLLSWFGEHDPLPDPLLTQAMPFRTAGLCYYRDGRDSVAWHGDTIGRSSTEDTMVAIVSFGAPRRLALRPRDGVGGTLSFALGHGDLIVMGGSCQRTWEHAVPKTAQVVGPRISVQFRPRGVR